MRQLMHRGMIAAVCLLVGMSPVYARKMPKDSGYGGTLTSPNLKITLSTGGSKSGTPKSSKSRKSGRRSGRRRKSNLPIF